MLYQNVFVICFYISRVCLSLVRYNTLSIAKLLVSAPLYLYVLGVR